MNRGELKTIAKRLMDERGDYWSDTELNDLCSIANRAVWAELAARDEGRVLAVRTYAEFAADAMSLSLTSAPLSLNMLRILSVSSLKESAVVSPTNKPTPLEYVEPNESAMYYESPADPYSSRDLGTPRWTIDGNWDLYLIPPPTTPVNLLLRYIPRLIPASLDDDADEMLAVAGGATSTAPEFQDSVIGALTHLMASKERDSALVSLQGHVKQLLGGPAVGRVTSRRMKITTGY
tara:strand:+ start:328 stop:1032 length:705 start_codon:yes stop_codon:yes gene_type:complete